MSETSLQNVTTQEKAVKPILNASPGLGAWLREVGGSLAFTTHQSARLFLLSAGKDVAFLPAVMQPYTPGFSEPQLHRALVRALSGEFAVVAPQGSSRET